MRLNPCSHKCVSCMKAARLPMIRPFTTAIKSGKGFPAPAIIRNLSPLPLVLLLLGCLQVAKEGIAQGTDPPGRGIPQLNPGSSPLKVTDRVLFIRGDLAAANAAVLMDQDDVAVFDCGDSETWGQYLDSVVRMTVVHPRYSYVVMTHHHMDHTAGFPVFAGATIVAQDHFRIYLDPLKRIREGTAANGGSDNRENPSAAGLPPPPLPDESPDFTTLPDYHDSLAPLVLSCLPDTTFDRELTIRNGRIPIRLFHMGRFHSDSDLVAWIPSEGILVCGDLFYRDQLPVFSPNLALEVDRWVEVLTMILDGSDDSLVVLPGHGEPFGREELRSYLDYVETLRAAILQQLAEGKTGDEVVQYCSLERLAPSLQEKDVRDNRGGSLHVHNTRAMIRSLR